MPNLIRTYCDFMHENICLMEINLPRLESVGGNFLCNNENPIKLNLPRLKEAGFSFLENASVDNPIVFKASVACFFIIK